MNIKLGDSANVPSFFSNKNGLTTSAQGATINNAFKVFMDKLTSNKSNSSSIVKNDIVHFSETTQLIVNDSTQHPKKNILSTSDQMDLFYRSGIEKKRRVN